MYRKIFNDGMADGKRVSLEIHDRPSQTEDFGTAQPVIQRNRHDGIKRRPAKSRYNAFSFLCGKENGTIRSPR